LTFAAPLHGLDVNITPPTPNHPQPTTNNHQAQRQQRSGLLLPGESMNTQRKPKPPPAAKFAVVLNPGTLFQQVDVYCSTLSNAEAWARDIREPNIEADVMKVLSDGSLTTEF
jgi:hypothetical protein